MQTIYPLFFPLMRVKKSLFWISARHIYDDVQMYIIENFPESTAAEIYLASADELLNGVETYASARGYYTYIYQPGRAGLADCGCDWPRDLAMTNLNPKPIVQEILRQLGSPCADRQRQL